MLAQPRETYGSVKHSVAAWQLVASCFWHMVFACRYCGSTRGCIGNLIPDAVQCPWLTSAQSASTLNLQFALPLLCETGTGVARRSVSGCGKQFGR